MREHPRRFQSPGEAAVFWLNLGSKAEVNELFREWRPVHAKIGSEPRDDILAATTNSRSRERQNWDRVAARSDGHGSRLRPFPGARPPRRGQWTAGAHRLPIEFVTVAKVSNDRMRGSLFSSCKISLLFRFEGLFHSSVKLGSVQLRLVNPKAFFVTDRILIASVRLLNFAPAVPLRFSSRTGAHAQLSNELRVPAEGSNLKYSVQPY
jgi:hypothetical protein